jgi:TonB family protein
LVFRGLGMQVLRTLIALAILATPQALLGQEASAPTTETPEYYPKDAREKGRNGAVVLSCTVTSAGTLKNCKVVSETPGGLGFGDSALKLAATFRMKPRTSTGQSSTGGTVRIPIHFRVPD